MLIKEVINHLEEIAPPVYQESYDNAGLIVGNSNAVFKGAILCLDSTEAVVEEAIEKKCNLIVAHHPIIFKGLKRLTGKNYIERTIIKAIRYNIAIYAIHTNLDNVHTQGVNAKIAEKIGLKNTSILAPKKNLKKLFTFLPTTHSDVVRIALLEAGAGIVNELQHVTYSTLGVGTVNGGGAAQMKLEVQYPVAVERAIIKALEKSMMGKKLVYDIMPTENINPSIGSGIIGNLPRAMKDSSFLKHLKSSMELKCFKYTPLLDKPIEKVAICGGSGGFLLKHAIAQGADIFITSDYKYHEFFDADGRIVIADIGHYESERFTINLLYEILSNKFSNFALHCTQVITNPVQYYV